MAQTVVTELVIDSSRAVQGADAYTRAMDSAQSAMQRNLGALSNMIPSITQIAVGVGAAAVAFAALSKVVQEFTHGLADMGQAARRAGLDVESFQKLQFAASLEGISNKDFASGVEKMAARLNDASRNENELSKLLDANNIKFKDANGTLISTNALLEKARDLISREPLEQNKRVIAEMLGLTKEWVPLLDKSAQQFAAIQTEAVRLGLVIDASTIKKAEEFDREWRKSSEVLSVWIKSKLADLLPVLDDLINRATLFGRAMIDAFNSINNSAEAKEFSARDARAREILSMLSGDNSAQENANLVVSAGKAIAGTLSEQTKALLDQKIAADQTAKMWNDIASGWENAAAAGQNLIKSIPSGAANDNGPRPIIPAKDTTDSKDALDRSIDSLKRHTEVMLADADAQGLGAQALQEYRAIAELVAAAERADIDVTGKLGEKFADLATKAGEAAKALAQAKVDSNNDFATKTRLLSNDDVAIAQQLRGIYGNDVPAAMASTEAAQMRLNGAIREGRDNAITFVDTLVKGLFDAKAGSDSVSKGFEALSKSLTSTAIKQLLSGDFEKAAVSAISAVVTWVASLVSHTSDLKGTIAVLDRLNQLRLRNVQATSDANTLQGQLAVFNANAVLQQIEEARKGGELMGALLQVQAQERLKIETDFQKQAADLENQAADARLARQQSLEDRIFAATNDTSTLEGALAAQQRDFAKERLDEAKNGNLDLAQLTVAQQAEELSLRKSFNDKALEQTKQAAEAELAAKNQAAKSIVDYLTGLTSGPGSTLAPTSVLSNAQSSYNANYALALGGNADAQNKFVSLADNLEKAARAVYASGQGYQDIRNQIINQGLALPAVQQTTDPVVASLRDVLSAIQLNGSTQALDSTLNSVIKAAIDAGNATAIAALLVPKFDHLDTTADGALNFSEFVAGLGPQYANLTTDPTTAALLTNAQLRAQQLGVVGPLTNDQIAALGLSQEQGNVLNVFRELDGNGNGILEKSEAIKAATQGTQGATASIQSKTDTVAGNTANVATRIDADVGTNYTNGLQGITNLVKDELKYNGLNAGAQVISNSSGISTVGSAVTGNNNILTALNKIVVNTYATSVNTYGLVQNVSRTGIIGTYATGGVIPPFGLGLVSEHLNPTWVRAGAEPITVSPFTPSAGNDNSALLAEMKRLNDKIERLERVIAGSGANIARAVIESGEHVADTVETQTDTLAAQERQSNRQRKVA